MHIITTNTFLIMPPKAGTKSKQTPVAATATPPTENQQQQQDEPRGLTQPQTPTDTDPPNHQHQQIIEPEGVGRVYDPPPSSEITPASDGENEDDDGGIFESLGENIQSHASLFENMDPRLRQMMAAAAHHYATHADEEGEEEEEEEEGEDDEEGNDDDDEGFYVEDPLQHITQFLVTEEGEGLVDVLVGIRAAYEKQNKILFKLVSLLDHRLKL
jgi:hypothetical protein